LFSSLDHQSAADAPAHHSDESALKMQKIAPQQKAIQPSTRSQHARSAQAEMNRRLLRSSSAKA